MCLLCTLSGVKVHDSGNVPLVTSQRGLILYPDLSKVGDSILGQLLAPPSPILFFKSPSKHVKLSILKQKAINNGLNMLLFRNLFAN